MKYPEHIYDPLRINMAEQLIEKELAKLLKGESGSVSRATIQSWRERPSNYHLEEGVRDFWDIFAAIVESIKLKPSFTAFLTADNYHWKYEEIPVESIRMSSYLDTLKNIPNLVWKPEMTVGEVMHAIETPEELAAQKENSDQHSDDSQNEYPIIVRKSDKGDNRVMDGNRRALRAALYGQETITAWVAYVDEGTVPRNYWVPVNDMMQLVKLFVLAKTDTQRQSVRNSLEILFQQTIVARIVFDERVAEMKGAKELMSLKASGA